jgi:hypothetical protein
LDAVTDGAQEYMPAHTARVVLLSSMIFNG